MFKYPVNLSSSLFGVTTISSCYNDMPHHILNEIYRSRKNIFIERKKWDIESYKGGDLECDQYDEDDSYYIYILDKSDISGCVRLRPSTSPTLMTGSLKRLKNPLFFKAKNSKSMWEASRFFITQDSVTNDKIGGIDTRTYALFISMIEFSMVKGFMSYEVVVDAMMMRILRQCGWPLKIISSDIGSLNEKIYYGTLQCNIKTLNNILCIAYKKKNMR
ncbi:MULTISPECIES: acyl-homoserine-lactone synthase [unclassified Halomonas]|uniref:acyl-homoserine-lactone synthase n=1 Tax=unclassified Halomonas TaxID=2609666 RepID=UPI0009903AF5|nr:MULTISPECIES: acyl-homoserine-lactone synthase [unclassified Halomonas]AQU81285.1 hypothetical protein B2G49_00835 [Halomonas sp. 'Soap Lake \